MKLDFSFWRRHYVKAFKVLGTPWLDDMDRFPSRKLRVEFIGGNGPPSIVQQEDLYRLFRLYGKIADIIPHATPAGDLPRHAMIRFRNARGAITAKNCLDGYIHQETGIKLRILYGRGKNTRRILDWIVNNPRLAFPLIIAILGFFAVWVFDPVRGWSIRQRIKGGYDFSWRATRGFLICGYEKSWRAMREFPIRALSYALPNDDMIKLKEEHPETKFLICGYDFSWRAMREFLIRALSYALPNEDMIKLKQEHPETIIELEKLEKLKKWMKDAAVVVYGPRRGKFDLLRARVLDDNRYVLVIDCKAIAEAPNDGDMVEEAASEIGYRPLFSQFNYLTELALRAVMGPDNAAKKSSGQAKLDRILTMMKENMKRLALEKKGREHKDMSDEDFLHEVSDTRPILILNNFRHKEEDSAIYEKLAEWYFPFSLRSPE
jgi:hypothetical protein